MISVGDTVRVTNKKGTIYPGSSTEKFVGQEGIVTYDFHGFFSVKFPQENKHKTVYKLGFFEHELVFISNDATRKRLTDEIDKSINEALEEGNE